MKWIVIGLLLACGVMASGYAYMSNAPKITYRYDYTVRYGDTLWDIAAANVPPDEDIREYIYNLKAINDGDIVDLKPGQRIELYYY